MQTLGPQDRDCTAPEEGRLLLDYVLKSLDEARSTAFEAHILECDACYENFTALVRTSSYLADLVAGRSDSLPPAIAFLKRRSRLRWLAWIILCLALLGLGFLAGYLAAGARHGDRAPELGRRFLTPAIPAGRWIAGEGVATGAHDAVLLDMAGCRANPLGA